jgi:hypothetical protein
LHCATFPNAVNWQAKLSESTRRDPKFHSQQTKHYTTFPLRIHTYSPEKRTNRPVEGIARTQSHELSELRFAQNRATLANNTPAHMKTKGWSDQLKIGRLLDASAGAIF